jgi:hypothetical protein
LAEKLLDRGCAHRHWLARRPSERRTFMIDFILAGLSAGLVAFLALFMISFLVLGLIFGIVHLFVMVLYDPRDDRATVHQKQTV